MDYLPNDPLLIILALVFIFLTLFVLAIIFINTYTFFGKWLKFLERESQKDDKAIEQQAYANAQKILDDAKKSALKIIEESTQRAQIDVLDANQISDKARKELQDAFTTLSQNHIKSLDNLSSDLNVYYEKLLKEHREHNTQLLSNSAKSVENALLHEVDQFASVLQKETKETEELVDKKLNDKYNQLDTELQAYKDKKLNDINEHLYEIMALIAKDVLGRALNLEAHQEYIRKRLDDIRRKETGDNENKIS